MTIGPGGIDWESRWRELVLARERQTDALQWGDVRPGSDFWERRGQHFARLSAAASPESDPLLRAMLPRLDPAWTVLDVGAGAGRHTVPLARHVRRVVAVEPSPALAGRLRERLVAEGIGNATVVNAGWEAAEVEPADLAVCANVLYPIAEAGAFLRKLDAAAPRVWLVHRAAAPTSVFDRLWLTVRGQARHPEPSLHDLYALLGQIGVVANVTLAPIASTVSWADLDEAAADALDRLAMSSDDPLAAEVRAQLAATLAPGDDGQLRPPPSPTPARVALVWWER